jgi:hypothetical protein
VSKVVTIGEVRESGFFAQADVDKATSEILEWAKAHEQAAKALQEIWRRNIKGAGHKAQARALMALKFA